MSKELFEMYLDNLNTSIELIDVIIPTIKTFEGKVYNKRFENAINDALLQYFGNDYNKTVYFGSNIYSNSICFRLDFHNYSGLPFSDWWRYLPSDYQRITILNEWQSMTEPHIKYISIDTNKLRINASLIIEALKEQKVEIRNKIEELKEQALCVDEWRKRLEAIQKEAKELNSEIPHEIKTFFELETIAVWR